MLFGHRPHVLRPGYSVLVWGASGGLGSMAIQLFSTAGANAIGVGQMLKVGTPDYAAWFKEARRFGAAIWETTGKGNIVDIVFEHPGE